MTDEMSTAAATFDRNLPTLSRRAYFARQAVVIQAVCALFPRLNCSQQVAL
jgi:hypothetical protein